MGAARLLLVPNLLGVVAPDAVLPARTIETVRALRQLQAMRGRTVVFHTSVAVFDARDGRLRIADVPTTVTFRSLQDDQLGRYLELDEPYDCAGSAKVESLGIVLAERIESTDPTALIGLPLIALTGLLFDAGISIF